MKAINLSFCLWIGLAAVGCGGSTSAPIPSSLTTTSSPEGTINGGGGMGVFCPSTGTLETLDLHEARLVFPKLSFTSNPSDEGDEMEGIADFVAAKLARYHLPPQTQSHKFASYEVLQSGFKNAIQATVVEKIQFVEQLPLIHDLGEFSIDKNCQKTQIGIYTLAGRILAINKRAWDRLNGINKAALIAHEYVYRHYRDLGDRNSRESRIFVAHLVSDQGLAAMLGEVPAGSDEVVWCQQSSPDASLEASLFFVNKNSGVEMTVDLLGSKRSMFKTTAFFSDLTVDRMLRSEQFASSSRFQVEILEKPSFIYGEVQLSRSEASSGQIRIFVPRIRELSTGLRLRCISIR